MGHQVGAVPAALRAAPAKTRKIRGQRQKPCRALLFKALILRYFDSAFKELAEELLKDKILVKIVEMNPKKANKFSESLPGATIKIGRAHV